MSSKLSWARRVRRSSKCYPMEIGDQISPSADKFGESFKILFSRWKGSIYKLLWRPFLLYFTVYILITVTYEHGLGESGKRDFQMVAAYCSKYTSSIPVVLLLGFFTSTAMQRWFATQTNIPGTARAITVFSLSMKDTTADGPKYVQQYSRWLLLSWLLAFRMVCAPLRQQYPNLMAIEHAGFLLDHERVALETEELRGGHGRLSLHVVDWILQLLRRVNRQSSFYATQDYTRNIEVIMAFKKSCGNVMKFASNNIPFALIQGVTITVSAFGMASLMSRHYVESKETSSVLTSSLPFLQSIQYFLYLAWLKFGQMAANPFGEDEDDIDIKKLFLGHVQKVHKLCEKDTNATGKLPFEKDEPESKEREMSSTRL